MNSWSEASFCSEENYKNGLFAKVPQANPNEALILTGGIRPDILVKTGTKASEICKGKYNRLVRMKLEAQMVSGSFECYCKDNVYQFQIQYKMSIRVEDALVVWHSIPQSIESMIDSYVRRRATLNAGDYDMESVSGMQSKMDKDLRTAYSENGFSIGPIQDLSVDIDPRYREFLTAIRVDEEESAKKISEMEHADWVYKKMKLTEGSALTREYIDDRLTPDELLQKQKQREEEMWRRQKQRENEDFNHAKARIADLEEMRRNGTLDEETYRKNVSELMHKVVGTTTPNLDTGTDEYAPDPDDE